MTFFDDPNRQAVGLAPIWGGAAGDNVPNAAGATAGTPGTWTPPGSDPAASPAAMSGIVATPATKWALGQYVQTATAGAGGRVHWSGTAWVAGTAPAEDPAEDPGAFTIPEVEEWVDDHPDLADEVLAAERRGKARSTLLDWLAGFIAHRDDDD